MRFIIVLLALVGFAAAQESQAATLRQSQDISPEGSYAYEYETSNGINAIEAGSAGGAQGQYSYTAPDGTPIVVTYVADANGYHAQGAHIPVAPPIPEAIQRAIAYNIANAPKTPAQSQHIPLRIIV